MITSQFKRFSFSRLFCICTVLVAIALLSLALRSDSAIVELPLSEDGYYLLSVSRHIALGNGITIDGQQWTNGFQPLFAFLMVPVYFVFNGDLYDSLRGVLASHWLMQILTALLLGSIVKTVVSAQKPELATLGFWITAFLWMASRYVVIQSYNGLETGCALLFYALVWRLYQLDWVYGWKLVGFSVVLGLLVLARIDAVFFVIALAVGEFCRTAFPLRERFVRAATMSVISFLVSSPWWLYNLLLFGSLIPSSGTSQNAPFSFGRVQPLLQSILQVWTPYLQIRWIEGVLLLCIQIAIIAILCFVCIRYIFPWLHNSNTLYIAIILVVSTSLLALYYLFTSGSYYFYNRYLTPYMLIAVPLAALALLQLGRFRQLIYVTLLVSLTSIAFLSAAGWYLQIGVSKSMHYNEQLPLIEAHVPPSDAVSAAQSGTIGYFRERVVNLDGKVNAEALNYARKDIWQYLERRGVTWLCEFPTDMLGPDPAANGWVIVAQRDRFTLYHRVNVPSP